MMMKKKLPLALALSAFALACSDSTGPVTRTLDATTAPLAITASTTWPFPILDGQVQLCKTSNVTGTFTFTASGGGASPITPLVTNPSITIDVAGETECIIIYRSSTSQASGAETITVTENANAVPLTNIDIVQYLNPAVCDGPFVCGNLGDAPYRNDAFSVAGRQATLKINNDMARRVTFTNTQAPTGGEGCTPGFWKNNADKHDASQWGAIDPDATFTSVFGANDLPAGTTLLEALNLGGGGVNALARHAVAAYLNSLAGDPDYAFTTAQVIAKVQAMASNNYDAAKDELATENERGCPLSQNGDN
jgi:hypothetical protein